MMDVAQRFSVLLVIAIIVTISPSEGKPTQNSEIGPPQFKQSMIFDVEVSEDEFRLKCPVEGNPRPEVKWLRNGEVISEGTDKYIAKRQSLRVLNVSPEDAGIYSCRATNIHGELWGNFTVYVNGSSAEYEALAEQVASEAAFFATYGSSTTNVTVAHANYGGRPGQSTDTSACNTVTSVPHNVRSSMRLSTFYQKYTHAYNIPVLSSNRVPDNALKRACYVVRFMMADRRDLRQQMYDKYGRVGIMAQSEVTLHIPEHSRLPAFYNERARGLGGTLHIPISTGAEENVLCYTNDRYRSEDIFLHEFAHGIHKIAAVSADSTFEPRLRQAYNSARSRGLWRGTYAMNTVDEYFAEGTQSYFDQNPATPSPGIHNHVNTRSELRTYDPTLYNLVKEVFPCGNQVIDRCQDQSGIHTDNIRMNCNGGTEPTGGDCVDKHNSCQTWANRGECSKNPEYMLKNCEKSCNQCDEEETVTEQPPPPPPQTTPEMPPLPPQTTPEMPPLPPQTTPEQPPLPPQTTPEEPPPPSQTTPEEPPPPPQTTPEMPPPPPPTTESPETGNCVDNNNYCSVWASRGECQRNPTYMLSNCQKSCNRCTGSSCTDNNTWCSYWAGRNECYRNPTYMHDNCKKSCNKC